MSHRKGEKGIFFTEGGKKSHSNEEEMFSVISKQWKINDQHLQRLRIIESKIDCKQGWRAEAFT